jgi:hypothetical protein
VAYERFTGLAHARRAFETAPALAAAATVAIVDEGKHAWAVREALRDVAAEITDNEAGAAALVIGTLSPGPIEDALGRRAGERRAVIAPWSWETDPTRPGQRPATAMTALDEAAR